MTGLSVSFLRGLYYTRCMDPRISVVIPNRNGSDTIKPCLEAIYASPAPAFEVIVVDDCSDDNSVAVIQRFPCTLIRLERHSGASRARNAGANRSAGDILFFIDADCLVRHDTLSRVRSAAQEHGAGTVIGGTYTPAPQDPGFFSLFQSVFIHYFETKSADQPDYVASHAMVIAADTFRAAGGFPEEFLPIIEDVEFSHRLRRSGYRLLMDPSIQVRHIFNFTLARSLKNGMKKAAYWTAYSLRNRDVFSDSGTASRELKTNVVSYFLMMLCMAAGLAMQSKGPLLIAGAIAGANLLTSRGLLGAFRKHGGLAFAFFASIYYAALYPLTVGLGAVAGMVMYFRR